MARTGGNARAIGVLVTAFLLLGIAVLAVYGILRDRGVAPPTPGQQRCVATANGSSTALSLDQAHYASIIVGVSVRRDLPPRAATIALATAYQETGIRNLDYGDRDSVGLFQQRPSQGWGTEKQLMDPYYAANKFYNALLKVKNWSTRDITEVAQAVQRSAYPEACRDHEADARNVASALTGHSPGGFSCLEREGNPGKPAALAAALTRTFGKLELERTAAILTVTADSAEHAWAYGSFAIANSRMYGTVEVVVAARQWRTDAFNLPDWTAADDPIGKTEVRITVR
ncbi:hypothetical protein [Microlunatus ginsengisoli]|uniref:Heavy metal transporter n=1 Tax=Microlunatus ginsengisoli TaxID=363863 RepID=A0ABP7ASU6_9ACTN